MHSWPCRAEILDTCICSCLLQLTCWSDPLLRRPAAFEVPLCVLQGHLANLPPGQAAGGSMAMHDHMGGPSMMASVPQGVSGPMGGNPGGNLDARFVTRPQGVHVISLHSLGLHLMLRAHLDT